MDTLPFILGFLPLLFCGLRATVHGAASCGEQLNAKDAGYITSPGYPHDYPSHQTCEWIITAPEANQKIVLNFNPHFEIEKHDCKYDFIEIRDGDNEMADLLGKHCGSIAPAAIISSGSSLYIRFISDYARQGAGFSLRYELFRTGSEDCSRNFTGPNGTIESPGFPDKYPHNLDCTFTILAKPKQEIVLQFLTFDLEHDPLQGGEGDCKYDWLDIWDGVPTVGPLIGRYCGTKTPSEIRTSNGILSLTFHTDMAVAKDGFSARYHLVAQEIPEAFQCNVPLGMESGRIANEQITASSTYTDMRWTAQQSRLNSDENGWTPKQDSPKEYLQVDLRFLTLLTAIATQGAISKETQNGYYVKSYKLEISTNGEDWMMFRHGKNQKVFQGNTDPSEVVLNKIHQPVLTRFVRIRPQAWHSGIAMRIELYGCQITDSPCTNMMGMLSGLLSDAQITASSSREYVWAPGAARLVSSRSGWFPHVSNPAPGAEWLQVDLSVPKTVKGVIIQGARGGDSIDNRAFVRKFKVAYSMNGKDWEYVQNSKKEQAKLFEGNMHYDTPEFRMFDPVPAQYVRIYPEKWSPAGVGMRLEVLGCDLMEVKPTSETMKPTKTVEETTTQYPTEEYTTECGDNCGDNDGTQVPAGFNCNFDSAESLCRWSEDTTADGRWSLQSRHPWIMPAESNQYLRLFNAGRREGETARIISPKVFSPKSGQCLVFRYQAAPGHGGSLRVLRRSSHENKLLWIIKEDQGHDWKEGKIMLPSYEQEYQIVIEGVTGRGHSGEVTVDDIHIDNDISLDQCMEPFLSFPWVTSPYLQVDSPLVNSDMELFPEGNTGEEAYYGVTDIPAGSVVTPMSDKEKNWLYTLDPILVTIIAMSSLGVLLGAVCAGLLLYCTCSYTGLSSRSSTTLENYNFELYDGVKHKVKMNPQKCCSEA